MAPQSILIEYFINSTVKIQCYTAKSNNVSHETCEV